MCTYRKSETVSILYLYVFDTPAQIQGLFLFNYIPPPPQLPPLFAYFLISGYLLQTTNILGVDCIAVSLTPKPIKYDPNIIMYHVATGYIPKICQI